jgi:hypothetical protein
MAEQGHKISEAGFEKRGQTTYKLSIEQGHKVSKAGFGA